VSAFEAPETARAFHDPVLRMHNIFLARFRELNPLVKAASRPIFFPSFRGAGETLAHHIRSSRGLHTSICAAC
jgi:hypothetical protein